MPPPVLTDIYNMKHIFLIFLLLIIPLPLLGATFSVDTVAELETALSTAENNGENDTIYIAAGNYNLANTLSYDNINEEFSISLLGNRGETIIDGQSNRVLFMRTYSTNATITLNGISFINGYAQEGDNGAGIFINSSSDDVTIEDCQITDCFAAAFYNTNHGGGAYITVGGNATVIFRNCVIAGNQAKGLGGGMYLNLINGTLYFINNTVIDNINKTSVVEGGGGIYLCLYFDTASAHIYNNILWGNTYSNGNFDGDMYIEDNGSGSGSGATVYVYNNNYKQLDWNSGANITFSDNMSSDPLLTDSFRLNRNSPCIDQAYADAPNIPSHDFNGDPRSKDGDCNTTSTPDIGADEYSPLITTAPITSITTIKANSGGSVADDEGHTITSRGVCWSTQADPTIQDSCTTDGSGSGSFVSSLIGLSSRRTYFVRAYACSCEGESYGNVVTFSSRPTPTAAFILPLLLNNE